MRTLSLLWMLVPSVCLAAGEGLSARDASQAWPQWQARLSLSTGPARRFGLTDFPDLNAPARNAVQGGAVLGDYYFGSWNPNWLAPQGAFRATGGLMFGNRSVTSSEPLGAARLASRMALTVQSVNPSLAGDGSPAATVPYVGIGYTGLSVKGGWGFTADLGLTAEGSGAAPRLGRALLGNQGSDTAFRELRLSPLLQVGVSYSF